MPNEFYQCSPFKLHSFKLTDCRSADQEILLFLWDPKVQYSVLTKARQRNFPDSDEFSLRPNTPFIYDQLSYHPLLDA
jgi:hypothetical protein